MKGYHFLYGVFFLGSLQAQEQPGNNPKPEKAKAIVDTEIAAMTREISAYNIKGVLKMAGFGTRHSLSDTAGNTRGVGAARRWVADKFRKFALRHRANLRVALDSFNVTPNPAIPAFHIL